MQVKPRTLVSSSVAIAPDLYALAQKVAASDDISYNKYVGRLIKADLILRGVLKAPKKVK